MKGYEKWSYAPYTPLLADTGDIYVCRIVPDKNNIHLEWLDGACDSYRVFYKKTTEEQFSLAGNTDMLRRSGRYGCQLFTSRR